MNKEKFTETRELINYLLKAQAQVIPSYGRGFTADFIQKKFDDFIIDAARDLIAVVDEGKKSEMPCNCCKEELAAQEAMAEMVDAVDKFVTAINKLANKTT